MRRRERELSEGRRVRPAGRLLTTAETGRVRPGAFGMGCLLGVGTLLALGAVSCNDPACPYPQPGWQSRSLSVEQMEAIRQQWVDKAVDLYHDRPFRRSPLCAPVPIGVDERNGLPVYLTHECNDLCPDEATFLITYDPDTCYGREDAEALGVCYAMNGASLQPTYCLPYPHGYSDCTAPAR